MQYRLIPNTSLSVSEICLGTMTWGEQNTESQAHEQLDYALSEGVNFIDTAELYPVAPVRAETYGSTETYIGNWLKQRGRRDDIILSSKIAGASRGMHWIRGGNSKFNESQIHAALEGSLKRLQTDYIDVYHLHWPERVVNNFGVRDFPHDRIATEEATPILETLRVLSDLVKQGKIRHIAVSNETPWGVMKFQSEAKAHGLSPVVAIQNPYNLLDRHFEIGLSEVSLREKIGLLVYSPLGGGRLSGKYLNGELPKGSRKERDPSRSRYDTPIVAQEATAKYVALAVKFGLDPSQMALAFVNSRPFVTSNIIGATTMEQLKTNIASKDITLSAEVLEGIELIYRSIPNPSC